MIRLMHYLGFESGSEEVLRLLNKGVDRESQVEAAERIKDAGIELCIYVLVSAGGRGLSAEHVRATTEAINRIAPACVDIQTLVPVPRTPLHDALERGHFELLSPHESIREIRLLLEGIEVPIAVNSNHISNYCNVEGCLPEDRERLLRELLYCLDLDERPYAVTDIVNVG